MMRCSKRSRGDESGAAERAALLRRRVAELDAMLEEEPDEEGSQDEAASSDAQAPPTAAAADEDACADPTAAPDAPEEEQQQRRRGAVTVTGPSERAVVRFPDGRGEVVVVIGTSEHAKVPGFVDRVSQIVDAAYSSAGRRKRVDRHDALHRLQMGDDGPRANRVLHLAFQGNDLVGCCSSTFDPGWTPENCGHWGLLAVDPARQGGGIATALVLAAERRLATMSELIQMEYSHSEGDEYSHRLMSWYEDRLGYDGGPRGRSGFRRCFKPISENEQRRGRRRRLVEVRAWLAARLAEAEEEVQAEAAAALEAAAVHVDGSDAPRMAASAVFL
eukprot:TRINITY_DN16932_c0_g1_i1.p1 TRINITY_DN16932_c0_g1~~TRINITY_DN16932_c0_g1_i1.p1  ORF type:complete len:332 (+),score=98.22 TRINITY_DN16932_c0_g1_i1:166-1161(+)